MSVHRFPHPEDQLADDCERCAEHAADPIRGLDSTNLARLVYKAVNRQEMGIPHGENEAVAVANVLNALERAGKIGEVAPDLLGQYLRERWRLDAEISHGEGNR